MSNKTTICRRALSELGVKRNIANIELDDSPDAVQCNLHYDTVRRALLSRYDWEFNHSWTTAGTVTLAIPHPVWIYAYQYPTDALRIRGIIPTGMDVTKWRHTDVIPFARGLQNNTRYILTNQQSAYFFYGADVDDVSVMPPTFQNALAWALAVHVAIAVSGGRSGIQRQAITGLTQALGDALATDGMEAERADEFVSEFEESRAG